MPTGNSVSAATVAARNHLLFDVSFMTLPFNLDRTELILLSSSSAHFHAQTSVFGTDPPCIASAGGLSDAGRPATVIRHVELQ